MNWLARLFASRRELKRLASDIKLQRERVLLLESELTAKNAVIEEKNQLLLELGFRWSDRFLTSQAKTFAITDEARTSLTPGKNAGLPSDDLKKELNAYREKYRREAKDAGLTEDEADEAYFKAEPMLTEQIINDFGFTN